MNERIKEVAVQSGIKLSNYYRDMNNPKATYSKGIVDSWSEETKQKYNLVHTLRINGMTEEQFLKFTQALIKECADIATNRYQRLMDGGKAIKEHFGVEE